MTLSELAGKRVLILGYGQEGKATEHFLRGELPDLEIGIADQTINPHYLQEQDNYDIVIRSPGIPKRLITRPSTTATNLFFSLKPGVIIGVTGTKGKSTTASLIYHILHEAGKQVVLAGNIGKPMLEAYAEHRNEHPIYVIELSSYMLDDLEYSPDYAVVVSLYPEHLDYHGGKEAYYEAKKNILSHANTQSCFFYNPRFEQLKVWANEFPGKSVPFNLDFSFEQETTHLIGPHNRVNMQGAATVAQSFGIEEETIRHALQSFRPLPHRLEKVGTYHGITFYDDAISTTPESTIEALASLPDVGTIFLGGLDRGYDFSQLVMVLLDKKIHNFVFFPDSGPTIRAMLEKHTTDCMTLETRNMEEAVAFAYRHTPAGKICLLSTASPSYSIWKNFEVKGDEFQKWVRLYAETYQEKKTK